jgi:riboflavin biosynthesis pyrimidine reductase
VSTPATYRVSGAAHRVPVESSGVRFLDYENCPTPDSLVAEHVALPDERPTDRGFVRLNMISSADGGSAVSGLSGGLGNRDDHAVYNALRANADVVLVGLGTVVAEHYRPPASPHLEIYVVANRPDISGDAPLFESGRATLVLPGDAAPAPDGVPELRAGTGGAVDLPAVVAALAGKVVVTEGGPMLAGAMVASGLVDEFFLTIAPRVISGSSARVVHGPEADPTTWHVRHGFVDDDGFLFLRYVRPS